MRVVFKRVDVLKPASLNFDQCIAIFLLQMHSGHEHKNLEFGFVLDDLDQRLDFAEVGARTSQE